LEIAFQDYNRQLLENKYNIKKILIPGYKKISIVENIESYNTSLRSLKRDYDKINDNLKKAFEHAYYDVRPLFSTEDFEKFYIQGNDVLQKEIAERKEKKEGEDVLDYLTRNSKFVVAPMDFQIEKTKYVEVTRHINLRSEYYTAYEDLYARREILYVVNSCKNKSYYPQVIDLVIEINTKLNTEWTKNGKYFKTKVDFYEAYMSDNYKQILKDNKKKK
jgi:hypothetical protein